MLGTYSIATAKNSGALLQSPATMAPLAPAPAPAPSWVPWAIGAAVGGGLLYLLLRQ